MNKETVSSPLKEYGINERLSDFILFLSDELRNPISVILLQLDLLIEQSKKDIIIYRNNHFLLLQAKTTALRLSKITNDQIDNIQADMEQPCPQITIFNAYKKINELIINANRILSDHHLSCITNSTAKESYIQSDEYFFERCLLCFISYAAKHSMKGQDIKITLDVDGFEVQVSVGYHGKESHLFGTDVPNRLKDAEPKFTFVKKLVELQGGRVWVDDKQELNSLHFTLPIKSEMEQSDFLIRTSLNISDRVLMELADVNADVNIEDS